MSYSFTYEPVGETLRNAWDSVVDFVRDRGLYTILASVLGVAALVCYLVVVPVILGEAESEAGDNASVRARELAPVSNKVDGMRDDFDPKPLTVSSDLADFHFRGYFDLATKYIENDVVKHGAALYAVLPGKTVFGIYPCNTDYWSMFFDPYIVNTHIALMRQVIA